MSKVYRGVEADDVLRVKVNTSPYDAAKFIDSNELVRTNRFQQQIRRLKDIAAVKAKSKPGTTGRGRAATAPAE